MNFAPYSGMQMIMSFGRLCRIVLLVLMAHLGLLGAQLAVAQSSSKVRLWQAQSQPSSVIAEMETQAYGSANENNESSRSETRLHLGLDLDFQKNLVIAGIKGGLWGTFPRESSSWMNIQEAFLGLKYENKQSFELKVGRVMPDWGGLQKYSPVKKLFPQFSLDPFHTRSEGMAGIYAKIKEELVDVEILLSPLFLPSLGGPLFTYKEDGTFYSPSRWALPLYYSATIGTAKIPLNFILNYPQPKDYKDILLRLGGAVRVTVKDFFEAFQLSGLILNSVDPTPRLKISGRLDILKEKEFNGNVNIFPEFYRHTAYGLEFRFKQPMFDMYVESLYRLPENTTEMEEYMTLADEWSNMLAIQTKHDSLILPQVLFGLTNTIEFDPYVDPYFKIPSPTLNHVVTKLEWFLNPKVKFHTSSEVSTEFDQGVWRNSLELTFTQRFKMTSGMDLIMGKDDTYWGQFRDQDRVWIKGSYAF